MSQDIIEMSRSINVDSVGKRGPGRPSKKSTSDDEKAPPPRPLPAAVKLPPPDSKEARRAQEDAKEAAEKRETAEYVRKVNSYLDSEIFAPILADLGLSKLKGNENPAIVKEAYNRIQAKMGMQYKQIFVNRMWDMTGQTVSQIGSNWFHLDHFRLFSDKLAENHHLFAPELEEIAIEMSPDYIPSAKVRLAMKLASFAYEFDRHARSGGVIRSSGTGKEEASSFGHNDEEQDVDEQGRTIPSRSRTAS